MSIRKEKFIESAVNSMLAIAGHTIRYKDLPKGQYEALSDEEKTNPWYSRYTMTTEQEKEFEEWFMEEYKKTFKASKRRAYNNFCWFSLCYGLRINDN